ncbi:MAG: hypothetical protein AAFV07_11680 [Bacteroidota bacterium]
MAGKDPLGQVRAAGQQIPGFTPDFQPGPISQQYDSSHTSRYDRVWKITADSLAYHIASWNLPGYVMPEAIATWPAHGDTMLGEARDLAPFVDVDSNGWYQPEMGDYPEIRGESAVFFMANDERSPQYSGGNPIRLEVQGMVYAFGAKVDTAFFETVFVHYRLINRNSADLTDTYMGFLTDFDIGNWLDDHVGTDVGRNMAYGYNGDDVDETWAGQGSHQVYGQSPPAQGIVFMNRPLTSSLVYAVAEADSILGLALGDELIYNNLQGLWADGTPMYYGGDGHQGVRPTLHMYDGFPERDLGWTDVEDPGERDMVTATGPFTFEAGKAVCIDVAFPFARSENGDYLESVEILRDRVDWLQGIYDIQNFACRPEPEQTSTPPTTSNSELEATSRFRLHPNPVTDKAWLYGADPWKGKVTAILYDLQGHQLKSWQWAVGQEKHMLDLESLPFGTYLLQVIQGTDLEAFRLYRHP